MVPRATSTRPLVTGKEPFRGWLFALVQKGGLARVHESYKRTEDNGGLVPRFSSPNSNICQTQHVKSSFWARHLQGYVLIRASGRGAPGADFKCCGEGPPRQDFASQITLRATRSPGLHFEHGVTYKNLRATDKPYNGSSYTAPFDMASRPDLKVTSFLNI